MDSFLLTDWITIQCDPSLTSITQSASTWLDLPDVEDVQLTLDVKEASAGANSVTMNYETGATRQDSGFVPLVAPFAMATGVRVDQAPFAIAMNPFARFLRWRLTASSAGSVWQATFRIWVSAHSYE